PVSGTGGLNLGPLQNNGGPTNPPTFTYALPAGSAAFAAGNTALDNSPPFSIPKITTDQRGLFRIVSGNVDVGAYQTQTPTPTPTAPTITTQPTNQSGTVGQMATFTATASGSPTPTVQWQVLASGSSTWSDITGATSTTLTLNTVTLAMSGNQYRAVFTN